MTKKKIELNFDEAFYYTRMGIERAGVFSGIVLNNNNSININSWHINDKLKFISDEYNIDEILPEFKTFVSRCALREMIELFDNTLLRVYDILNITKKVDEKEDLSELAKDINTFKKDTFPRKLAKIDELLNNELSKQKDFWQALQDIRNGITHNASIVHKKKINIKIPRFVTVLTDKDGNNEQIFPIEETIERSQAPNAEKAFLRLEYINKTFKKGDLISFTNEEIAYLIFGMQRTLSIFERTVLAFVFDKDIPVTNTHNKSLLKSLDELDAYTNDLYAK